MHPCREVWCVAGAAVVILLVIALVFGFAAGAVRENQGGSFGGGFAWGFFLGFIGLIVVVATKPAMSSTNALGTSSPSPRAPSVVPGSGSESIPQVPVAMRECPFCKEDMRRDASVCPHCRRESPAWSYEKGVWWAPNDDGDRMWLDPGGQWHSASEEPQAAQAAWLVLMSLGSLSAQQVAEIVAAHTTFPAADIRRLAAGPLPNSLFRAQGPTVAAIRDELTSAGATVEIV
jgi:hypothetical protein